MASVNRVTLIGNLGRDPGMRYLPSGEAVATFSIVTTETWKDKQGAKQERTDWHRIEFIGRTAEIAGEYLKKGRPVYVEGSIRYDKWTDKDGFEKTTTKIRGDRLQLLGSSDGDERKSADSAAPAAAKQPRSKLDDFDSDIPF